jgi:uncharacterized membrane protein YfcA
MVPGMVFFLGIRQHRAVGTSLAVILPTAVVGIFRYQQEMGRLHLPGIDFRVVLWLAVGGVFGARYGATLANRLQAKHLRRAFGVFVILTGMWMIGRSQLDLPHATVPAAGWLMALEMVGVGVLTGILSGLLGVGGGLIMVPALSLLLGYNQQLAQGMSLAVIIPVSISGAVIHWLRGNIAWSLAAWLALGAILGAWMAAGWVFGLSEGALRLLFGLFLLAVGVSMAGSRKPEPARENSNVGSG